MLTCMDPCTGYKSGGGDNRARDVQRTRSSCSAWRCDVCDKQVPINVHPVINNWFGIPNGYIKIYNCFHPIFLLSLLVFFGKLKIEFVAPFPQRTVEVRRHFNIN